MYYINLDIEDINNLIDKLEKYNVEMILNKNYSYNNILKDYNEKYKINKKEQNDYGIIHNEIKSLLIDIKSVYVNNNNKLIEDIFNNLLNDKNNKYDKNHNNIAKKYLNKFLENEIPREKQIEKLEDYISFKKEQIYINDYINKKEIDYIIEKIQDNGYALSMYNEFLDKYNGINKDLFIKYEEEIKKYSNKQIELNKEFINIMVNNQYIGFAKNLLKELIEEHKNKLNEKKQNNYTDTDIKNIKAKTPNEEIAETESENEGQKL